MAGARSCWCGGARVTDGQVACWPGGDRGPLAFALAPPMPCPPPTGAAFAYREGVEVHGTAFVVLHGRTCASAEQLRSYAAAALAAALIMEGRGAMWRGI